MPSSGIALFILRGASDFYAPHHHSSLREQSFQTQSRDGTPHGNPEPDNLNLELIISLFSKPLNDFLEIHAALFHILIHIERGAVR